MSIQSVNNQSSLAAIQNPATVSNAAQVGDAALEAFAQALGQFVSFQDVGALPSLTGIMNQAEAAAQNSAPPPAPVQTNTQPQQDNNGPQVTQNTQSGPVQQQVQQTASNNQPVKKVSNDDSDSDKSSTNDTQTSQSTDNSDPTSNSMVVAAAAQQAVQVVQTTVQVTVVEVNEETQTQQQTGDSQQNAANTQNSGATGPVGPTGPVQAEGLQIVGQTANNSGQNTDTQTQNQSNDQTDFSTLLSNTSDTTHTSDWMKSNAAAQQMSTKTQQANDLATSLNDTGANLSIKVEVVQVTETQTQVDPNAAADAAASQQTLTAALPQNTNLNGQGLNNQNSGLPDPNAVISPSTDVKAAVPDAQIQNVQAFSAVLAAQVEATQTETPVVQAETPAIGGVNAAAEAQGAQNNTQSTQTAQAPQAPQAPAQPRTLQQAQVMDQVSVQIAKQAKDGVDNITVKLNPQELGRVEIKLEVAKDGTVQATVFAENKDTLAMLQKDAGGLAKALNDAGLSTDAGSMNFNLQSNGQQFAGDANSQQNGGSNARQPWLAANSGLDTDTVAASAVAASSSSLSAVDLSV